MEIKKFLEHTNDSIKKTFEKIKRKALIAAPAMALALPGGATIAILLYGFAETHLSNQKMQNLANLAFDYNNTLIINNQEQIATTQTAVKNMLLEQEEDFVTLLGEDGYDKIFNQIETADTHMLEETAQMMGMKDASELTVTMTDQSPYIELTARRMYLDNLYDEVGFEPLVPMAQDRMMADIEFTDIMTQVSETTNQTNLGTGIGVALTAATMAVSMVLVHKQQKKAQRLENENALMEKQKTNQFEDEIQR